MPNYSELLKDPRWQKKRLEILQRDNFTCLLCSDTESTLHIHHQKYAKLPWEVENKFLYTLCCDCHTFIERIKNQQVGLIWSIYKMKYSDQILMFAKCDEQCIFGILIHGVIYDTYSISFDDIRLLYEKIS